MCLEASINNLKKIKQKKTFTLTSKIIGRYPKLHERSNNNSILSEESEKVLYYRNHN